jgi:uncharacterized protein (DUF885 family)
MAAGGCSDSKPAVPAVTAGSGDAAFNALATEIAEDTYQRSPSGATYLGIHKYDDQLEDFSAAAINAHIAAANAFKARLDAIDPATLTEDARLDREYLSRQMTATAVQLDVVRAWTKDADSYSTAATNSVYTIMKRNFAPQADRLKLVIAREKKIPGLLAEARKNLSNPPEIFTKIAIEQVDGNQSFFKNDLPLAFNEVKDAALLADFKASNAAVIAALGEYKTWLQKTLLPQSKGSFALGAATYSQLLAANEMVEMPLDQLLQVAEADRQKNEAALVETAKLIDPKLSVEDALKKVEAQHPPAASLLKTTQDALDALRQFIVDKKIVTIPASAPAHVQETPPFQRSTTSASMDTPGPFEAKATEAYYNMTLPDPRWTPAEQLDFMRQWYYAAISNVSVHEVYPGHYVQFLYAKNFPTITRKVFGANTNIEGWAHYAEQMMLDEGMHAAEPEYRMAQLQDALLRNVRFIVGIKMHTQGMTVDQAKALFETQGHQPAAIALSEAKRGAGDPFYGYYTMGKLAILKLRDDYKAKQGAAYSLQAFHDAFIKIGPLPLPLIREKMLGSRGTLF